VKCKRNVPTEQKNREVGSFVALQLFLWLKVNIWGWIEHFISRPVARKRSFVALLFISIFDLRFLQEKYARRVSMKYFKNIPGRVWSVCEANSLNIEMSWWVKFKALKAVSGEGIMLVPKKWAENGVRRKFSSEIKMPRTWIAREMYQQLRKKRSWNGCWWLGGWNFKANWLQEMTLCCAVFYSKNGSG